MNRRNCLKLLAALLPLPLVARMFGEKEVEHNTTPPRPNPKYKSVPYEAMMFSPTSGFHTEIRELGERWTIEGERIPPCFRAIIRDCNGTHYVCSVQSPCFEEHEIDKRRRALDCLYKHVSYVTRQRQFPKDTMRYDVEYNEAGTGFIYKEKGYPE